MFSNLFIQTAIFKQLKRIEGFLLFWKEQLADELQNCCVLIKLASTYYSNWLSLSDNNVVYDLKKIWIIELTMIEAMKKINLLNHKSQISGNWIFRLYALNLWNELNKFDLYYRLKTYMNYHKSVNIEMDTIYSATLYVFRMECI